MHMASTAMVACLLLAAAEGAVAGYRGWQQMQAKSSEEAAAVQSMLVQYGESLKGGSSQQEQRKSVDWRQLGKVTAVRNQGDCSGGGWAFAAVAAIESAYLIEHGITASIDLSEQQLLSCATSRAGYWSNGCQQGWSDMGMKYVLDHNITTENNYPFDNQAGVQGACSSAKLAAPSASYRVVQLAEGATAFTAAGNEGALRAAVDTQPVVVYWWGNEAELRQYSQGVYKPTLCMTDEERSVRNHAVVIVGYSYSPAAAPDSNYWIVRNSWGSDWGEAGYVRVAMDGSTEGPCGMYTYGAVVPIMAFSETLQ